MTDQEKLYTTAEFEQFINLPENQDRRFELIDGEIVEKPMPTEEHGVIVVNTATVINNHLIQKDIKGRCATEARHRPTDDSQNDRLPDVSFTAGDRPVVRRGPVDSMPDLVVEVKSPDDSYKGMVTRANFYLEHGTRLVWLIYPEKRLVEALALDDRLLLNEQDTLDGGDVLSGFSVAVKTLFRGV
jgi:Uma2 family endonuclease